MDMEWEDQTRDVIPCSMLITDRTAMTCLIRIILNLSRHYRDLLVVIYSYLLHSCQYSQRSNYIKLIVCFLNTTVQLLLPPTR